MANNNIDNAFTARSKTGAAFEPTYSGALSFMRRKYTKDVKGADAVVWGIPFDAAV
ncbi:agmatinase, partial [Mesorhizobium sp. M7D.F.Ca.US.004.03.1.1]